MRVCHLLAVSALALGMSGQPAWADDRAHAELEQDIEHETDLEWLRLACPNYVAAEAKRRGPAQSQVARNAPHSTPSAVTKCEKVLADERP